MHCCRPLVCLLLVSHGVSVLTGCFQYTMHVVFNEEPGRSCQQLRPGKKISTRKNAYNPYTKRPVGKEVQKWLILVDYQGDSPGEVVAFQE